MPGKATGVRGTYRFFGKTTWGAIREEMEAGATAGAMAAKYGPSRHTIYHRARKEGWGKVRLGEEAEAEAAVRAAAARAEAADAAEAEAGAGPLDTAVRGAWARTVEAMTAGRASEAQAFALLTTRLEALAERRAKRSSTKAPAVFVPARELDTLLGALLGVEAANDGATPGEGGAA